MNAQQLKESILQYAMSGNLVKQDLSEGNMNDVKENLYSFGGKTTTFFDEKTLQEYFSEIRHNNWLYTSLGSIIKIKSGKNLPHSKVSPGIIPVYGGNGIVAYHNQNFLSDNTIVIGRVGAHCGNVHITEKKSWVTDNAFIVEYAKDLMNQKFLMYLLKSLNLRSYSSSTAQPVISGKSIYPIMVGLPPLKEQNRIVIKIENMYRKIDEFGFSQNSLMQLQIHFPSKLKSSVLHFAMQGKLVGQDSSDEPATELIKRICEKKKKLVEEKVIKKEKPLPPIVNEEIPFDIPKSWEWTRLGDICQIEMGQSPAGNSVGMGDEGIEFHQGKSHFGRLFLESSSQITTAPRKIAPENSIVMSVRAPVGDVNITERNICIGRGLASIRPITNIQLKYLYYFLLIKKKDLEHVSTGSTFKAINKSIVINTLVPVPPLNEQKRIVKKIEDSFQILKQLD